MTVYFENWLRKKYNTSETLRKAWANDSVTFATVKVPGMKERQLNPASVFRDPQKERFVMDYYEAQQEVVAEDIIYFSKLIKDNWHRKIICGTFYGYFFIYSTGMPRVGIWQLKKCLNLPMLII